MVKRIICFGNSITYGEGAESGSDYPSLLGKLVNNEVINSGICGNTTFDALGRIDRDVLEKKPYLVIVEFGANDYFKKNHKKDVLCNLREIVSRVKEIGAKVALCDVSASVFIFSKYNIYHREIKHLAKNTGSIFIPCLMKGIIKNPNLLTDTFHPNSRGYRLIADRIYNAIVKHL